VKHVTVKQLTDLLQKLGGECRRLVDAAVSPLAKRLEAIEQRTAAPSTKDVEAMVENEVRRHVDEISRGFAASLAEAVAAALPAAVAKALDERNAAALEALQPQIRETVDAAVKAIEIPKPEAPPAIEVIVQGLVTDPKLAEIVATQIKATTDEAIARSLSNERVVEILRPLIPAPVKGDKGEPGESPAPRDPSDEQVAAAVALWLDLHPPAAGKDASPEQILAAVAEYLQAHPPAQGEPGPAPTAEQISKAVAAALELDPPPAGKDATPEQIAVAVKAYLEEHPPEDGADGADATDAQVARAVDAYLTRNPPRDGKDGESIEWEQVRECLQPLAEQMLGQVAAEARAQVAEVVKGIPAPPSAEDIEAIVGKHTAQWQLQFERIARDFLQHEVDRFPRPKDGRDAVPVDGFDVKLEGRRLILTLTPADPDIAPVTRELTLPMFEYHGVWKDGEYDTNAVVTFGGSAFIATRPTKAKPETDDSWRLIVKRGRDGKDGKDLTPAKGKG